MNFLLQPSSPAHKQLRIATAVFYSILLVLPGCGIPKLRGPEPVREIPDDYNGMNSGENSSQVSIEDFFSDGVLTSLIHQGLSDNLELKKLGEEIQIANNEVWKRSGAYLPYISLGAGAHLNKYSSYTILGADNAQNTLPNGAHFPQPYPEFMVAADFAWQIDVWRQLRNAKDAACLRYLGSIEGRRYVVTRLIAEIAENYYHLIALDKRIENLDTIIGLQEGSLERAKALKEGAQGTELGVQRFLAEVRKNQSEKLIIKQEIVEVENRINFLVGRYPERVERTTEFFNLNLNPLRLGVPSDLLRNRPDVRQAELELQAAGLDIKVARANFFPKVMISSGVGYQAFNPKYLFATPESLVYNVAGDLVAPLVNRRAIQADYQTANAKQLQALYEYQRTVLNAFTEVINRISMVQNYTTSLEVKMQQLQSLEASVDVATKLFQNARVQYMDVLFAQRDLVDARMVVIDTKRQQLSAIVNTYQALGGGLIQFDYPVAAGEAAVGAPTMIPPSYDEPAVVPPGPGNGAGGVRVDGAADGDAKGGDTNKADEAPKDGTNAKDNGDSNATQ